MKNKIYRFLGRTVLLGIVFLGIQCSEKSGSQTGQDIENPIPLPRLQADFDPLATADTKSVITPDGKVSWDAADRLGVFIVPMETEEGFMWMRYLHEYVTDEINCVNGVFAPNDQRSLDVTKNYAWYAMSPFSEQVFDPMGGPHSRTEFSLDGQCVDLSAPLAGLTAYDVVTGIARNVPGDQTPSLQMHHKCALMKFTLKNTDIQDITLEKVDFIAPEGVNIGGTYSIDFTPEGGLTPVKAKNQLTVDFTGDDKVLEPGASKDVYAVMPPFRLEAGSTFTLKVYTSAGVMERTTTPSTATTFQAGTLNTASISLYEVRLDQSSLFLNVEKKSRLQVLNLTPEMGEVSWSTTEAGVAAVDANGVVTGVSEGTAEITATIESSGMSFKCRVRVIGKRECAVMANDVPIILVEVPQGTYYVGADETTSFVTDWERPAHEVKLSDNYYIGKYEVTQELWETVMGTNPSKHTGNSRNPVEQVSWNDICAPGGFLEKLNALTGKAFSLPTEAQWEIAAKGAATGVGNDYTYSGSSRLDEVGWYEGNSNRLVHPVGTKSPNQLGIHDMSGNVWEWCSDWYGDYSSAPQIDPEGPASGPGRVCRGGSVFAPDKGCRITFRVHGPQDTKNEHRGFRLVLN